MGLRWLLRRLGIFSNAYYNYLKNRKAGYRRNKSKILTVIAQIYHERKGIPGYRLMTILLKNKGVSISGTTCHKYMFADIDDYVLLWYNSVRSHSFNNGLTPWQKRIA